MSLKRSRVLAAFLMVAMSVGLCSKRSGPRQLDGRRITDLMNGPQAPAKKSFSRKTFRAP